MKDSIFSVVTRPFSPHSRKSSTIVWCIEIVWRVLLWSLNDGQFRLNESDKKRNVSFSCDAHTDRCRLFTTFVLLIFFSQIKIIFQFSLALRFRQKKFSLIFDASMKPCAATQITFLHAINRFSCAFNKLHQSKCEASTNCVYIEMRMKTHQIMQIEMRENCINKLKGKIETMNKIIRASIAEMKRRKYFALASRRMQCRGNRCIVFSTLFSFHRNTKSISILWLCAELFANRIELIADIGTIRKQEWTNEQTNAREKYFRFLCWLFFQWKICCRSVFTWNNCRLSDISFRFCQSIGRSVDRLQWHTKTICHCVIYRDVRPRIDNRQPRLAMKFCDLQAHNVCCSLWLSSFLCLAVTSVFSFLLFLS